MATKTLVKHGTQAGYITEGKTGSPCDRCRAAHRVYNRQFSKTNRAKGIKYSSNQVIDHLDNQGKTGSKPSTVRTEPSVTVPEPPGNQPSAPITDPPEQSAPGSHTATGSQPGPSVRDRFAGLLGGARESYVNTDDAPDYIHPVEPDPEPESGDWSEVKPDEYVINEQGLKLIEGNLATYLSVVGITLEMIDPYCGPILADNFDNMVFRWTKVIGRYPKAAQLFMSEEGGTIMTWISALQATWPVLKAVYDHHLAKSIGKDNKPRFNRETVDATMPPMQPEYEYSVG